MNTAQLQEHRVRQRALPSMAVGGVSRSRDPSERTAPRGRKDMGRSTWGGEGFRPASPARPRAPRTASTLTLASARGASARLELTPYAIDIRFTSLRAAPGGAALPRHAQSRARLERLSRTPARTPESNGCRSELELLLPTLLPIGSRPPRGLYSSARSPLHISRCRPLTRGMSAALPRWRERWIRGLIGACRNLPAGRLERQRQEERRGSRAADEGHH